MKPSAGRLVEVTDLTIEYSTPGGPIRAVNNVTFDLSRAEIMGLVGESGSGKSTAAAALMGYLGFNAQLISGKVQFAEHDLLNVPEATLARIRGRRIALIPQNPATSLTPHMKIGAQLSEVLRRHKIAEDKPSALALAAEQLLLVGLFDSAEILSRYPHELSGGQQQRICIAMAIACRPELVVLDEPTTGLDVTTQARIVGLLRKLRSQFGIAMLYVTHDLGLLARLADRVGVMYAGELVELGEIGEIFECPRHPYSRGLLESLPRIDRSQSPSGGLRGLLIRKDLPAGCLFSPRCEYAKGECRTTRQILRPATPNHLVACQRWRQIPPGEQAADPAEQALAGVQQRDPAPLVAIRKANLTYRALPWWRRNGNTPVAVVRDLSMTINLGEVFALVGESGSGKSTIARAISGLLAPASGSIDYRGAVLETRLRDRTADSKRQIQYIFQNPDASLNPRERVWTIIARALRIFRRLPRAQATKKIVATLGEVQLDPSYVSRYPDELSGGERQRVAIARALIVEPSLLLCDEILSALDVSVQATVIALLSRLRQNTGVAMLFISHDLAVVRHLADRIGVLFQGTLVEEGATASLYAAPVHPYTEDLLLAATASLPPQQSRSASQAGGLEGGCVYARRCRRHRGNLCDEIAPPWQDAGWGHRILCHIPPTELAKESRLDLRMKISANQNGRELDHRHVRI